MLIIKWFYYFFLSVQLNLEIKSIKNVHNWSAQLVCTIAPGLVYFRNISAMKFEEIILCTKVIK